MPKSRDSSVQVAVIVAGLLAVIGGAWLFLNSGTDEVIETTQVVTTTLNNSSAPSSVIVRTEQVSVDTALQMAEMAFQSGQLTGEEEGTAFDFYRQVLEQDSDNARAKGGMQLIATQLVDEAEEMLAKNDYEQVVQRVKELNKIEAGSDAVLALQQQLAERASGMFIELDIAITDGQLDKAESLANSLRRIPDADSGRISSAIVTIAQTRKDREAKALALAQTPRNPQGIATTVSVAEFNNSRFNDETVENSASASGVESSASVDGAGQIDSTDTTSVLDPAELARNQIDALLKEAVAKVEQNRLVNPEGDNAVELFNQVLALETTNAEAKRGLRGIVQKLTSGAYDMAGEGDIEGARKALDSAEDVGIAASLVTQARTDVRAKWLELESKKVFLVSGFELEKSVPPKYPKRAMSRSIEGWVKVEFTVAEDGRTRDLQVVESSERLARQFSNSAVNAVKQWRFKPRILDGEIVAQRSETLVKFKLTE